MAILGNNKFENKINVSCHILGKLLCTPGVS